MIIATLDLETDPFQHGRVPKPFVAGFYDGDSYISIWGPDCVKRMTEAICKREGPYLIYAHNGGKFDFFFFLPYLSGATRIINSRIISARLGQHEVRDSYAIMPFPLREYDKDQIDYSKMEAHCREKHREEIISYLRKDCTALHELAVAFHAEFGDNLTIGASALKELKKRHKFKCGGPGFDEKFRTNFYFGGRVQVFKAGITRMNPISIYDVNSMYPHVMATALHPISTNVEIGRHIRPNTCFVVAEGSNYGAFPRRSNDGSLDFTQETGTFCTTIHEWQAAEQTKSFKVKRIIKTYGFDDRVCFDEFVSHFYGARKLAKYRGDKIHTLFYKFVLNSAYGKFAQNPENFSDYIIIERDGDGIVGPWGNRSKRGRKKEIEGWNPAYIADDYVIWQRPTERKSYYNICTGASITGAARALLLRGLHAADTPLYCDTDSIICRTLSDVAVSDNELGSWKLEASGSAIAIAGKKLYCVIDENNIFGCTCKTATKETPCWKHIKKAHKGAALTYDQIWRIAKGDTVEVASPVPAFGFDGKATFTTRRIRRTA